MSKKKKQTKKHSFKYVQPTGAETVGTVTAGEAGSGQAARETGRTFKQASGGKVALARDFGYVYGDVRRIGAMTAVLVGVEVILWLVLK